VLIYTHLGAEVKFVDIASMEGAFFLESQAIIVSTLRPEGRIRFTCAHELGHFIYNHGDHFDELVEKASNGENNEEERMADIFASFLLMPETTIKSFFHANNWNISSPSPEEIYIASSWLGTSYSSLINHLFYSLRLIEKSTYNALIKIQPKKIKQDITGFPLISNLIVLSKNWKGRPIELQVGDYIVSDQDSELNSRLLKSEESPNGQIYKALSPGEETIEIPFGMKEISLRVRKREYTGRSIYRHLNSEE